MANEPLISIVAICGPDEDPQTIDFFIKNLPKYTEYELIILKNCKGGDHSLLENRINDRILQLSTEWKELDLAKLRNLAKSKARGKWILSLDIDEVLPSIYHEELIEIIKNIDSKTVSIEVGVISCLHSGKEVIRMVHPNRSRLFKNSPKIKWEGRIHESVEWTITDKDTIVTSSLIIIHSGYETTREVLINKATRNLKGIAYELYKSTEQRHVEYYLTEMYATINLLSTLLDKDFTKNLKTK